MNGRIYDPQLARFLSPDPLVDTPTFSQSYNRYSYVSNNPLCYVDPSGYSKSMTQEASSLPSTDFDGGALEEVLVIGHRTEGGFSFNAVNYTSWSVVNSEYNWAYVGNKAYNMDILMDQMMFNLALANEDLITAIQEAQAKSMKTWNSEVELASALVSAYRILTNPESYLGETGYLYKGLRECAAFAQQAGGAKQTKDWKFGEKPDENTPTGTWIATPGPDGAYGTKDVKGNFTGGHVAVFMGKNADGSLKVIHQHKNMSAVDWGKIKDGPEGTYISNDASRYRILFW